MVVFEEVIPLLEAAVCEPAERTKFIDITVCVDAFCVK